MRRLHPRERNHRGALEVLRGQLRVILTGAARRGRVQVRHYGRDRRERRAQLRVPPRGHLVPVIQRACVTALVQVAAARLGLARGHRDTVLDMQQLALIGRAPVFLLPRADRRPQRVVNRVAARGIRVHLRLADSRDLISRTVRPRNPRHAETVGQLAFGECGGDGLHGRKLAAQRHRVQRPPFPVAIRPYHARDLVVNMVLRVAVAAGELQPRRHRDARPLEPARLLPVDLPGVVAGPGHPGPLLQVPQRRQVGCLQHVLELLLAGIPPCRVVLVAGLPGLPCVLPDRGV